LKTEKTKSLFFFLLFHKAQAIIIFLEAEKDRLLVNYEFNVIAEPTPMDTGGAVSYALHQLSYNGDFLFTNADTLLF